MGNTGKDKVKTVRCRTRVAGKDSLFTYYTASAVTRQSLQPPHAPIPMPHQTRTWATAWADAAPPVDEAWASA